MHTCSFRVMVPSPIAGMRAPFVPTTVITSHSLPTSRRAQRPGAAHLEPHQATEAYSPWRMGQNRTSYPSAACPVISEVVGANLIPPCERIRKTRRFTKHEKSFEKNQEEIESNAIGDNS